MNPEVFVGGVVVPHPFREWPGHAACADCHGARYARLGDNRPLHPLPRHLTGTDRYGDNRAFRVGVRVSTDHGTGTVIGHAYISVHVELDTGRRTCFAPCDLTAVTD